MQSLPDGARYLKVYANPLELMIGLTEYFVFYNGERPHQSLGNRTPAEVYATASGGGARIVDKFSKSGAAPCSCEQDGQYSSLYFLPAPGVSVWSGVMALPWIWALPAGRAVPLDAGSRGRPRARRGPAAILNELRPCGVDARAPSALDRVRSRKLMTPPRPSPRCLHHVTMR